MLVLIGIFLSVPQHIYLYCGEIRKKCYKKNQTVLHEKQQQQQQPSYLELCITVLSVYISDS